MLNFFEKNRIFLMKNDFEKFIQDQATHILNKELLDVQQMEYQGIFKINKHEYIFFNLTKKLTQTEKQSFIFPTAFFTLVEWKKDNYPYRKKGPTKVTHDPDKLMISYFFEMPNRINKPQHILKFRQKGTIHCTWKKDPKKNICLFRTNISQSSKFIEKVFCIKDEQLFIPDSWVFDFNKNIKAAVFNSHSWGVLPTVVDRKEDLESIQSILNDYSIDAFHLEKNTIPHEVSELFHFNFGSK